MIEPLFERSHQVALADNLSATVLSLESVVRCHATVLVIAGYEHGLKSRCQSPGCLRDEEVHAPSFGQI